MMKKSKKMFLKLVCVLLCTTLATVLAANEDPQASSSSDESSKVMTERTGELEDVTLIFDGTTSDVFDAGKLQHYPNLTLIKISQRERTLSANTFQGAKTLTKVFLDDNYLTAVPKEALAELPALTMLSISNNRLSTLGESDGLAQLVHLEILYLDRNFINIVHPNTFAASQKLRRLYLNDNRLTSLDGVVLPPDNQLEVLDVSHNFMKLLNGSIFTPLSGLRELKLAENLFETLRDNTFAELPALERLDLSGNFFQTLSPKLFTSNRKLEELRLVNNLIETLPVDVFSGLKSLESLSLEQNRLTSLPENIFRDQPLFSQLTLDANRIANVVPCFLQTSDVDLQNNRLTALGKASFDKNTTLVERLYLYGNEIATIEQSVFEGMPALESIYLDHNRLAELSPMLFHRNHQLVQVTLSHNRLSVLRTNTFSGLARLQQVDLSYNQLSAFEPGVFHDSPVEYLNLNGNQLKTLDSWAFGGTQLTYLHVDSNAIETLRADGTVLGRVRELSAANNRIASWLDVCAANFTRLRTINLAHNSIRAIEGGCWDQLAAPGNDSEDIGLDSVNVGQNPIPTVPALAGIIRTLDLSGTDVSDLGDGNAFRWYQQTDTLKLRNTSLRVVRSESFTFLPNLTNLQIGSSVLELVEEDAFHALKLGRLMVCNSSLQTLPPLLLKGQTELVRVTFAGNKLTELAPFFFTDCRMMVDIDLSQNRLTSADPRWFQGLEQLSSIYLDGNLITQLPPDLIAPERSLMSLSLAGNPLHTIANAAFLANLSIYELNLSNTSLEDIDILQHNAFISDLDVSGNRLERLLVRSNYYVLLANANRITSLQWEPDAKFNLVHLQLADNLLDHIDAQLFTVPKIFDLNVSENRLNAFPFELVYKLKRLVTLNVSRNNIRTLPPASAVQRFKLGTLDLSENPLEKQPNTFLDTCVVHDLILTVAK